MHTIDRTFVHLLAASIAAAFMLQAEWAIDHDFEYFSARVFSSALILFILLQVVRGVCRRLVPAADETFDHKYAESVLLLAAIPAFLVVENLFLRVVGILVYGAVVLVYMSNVLRVGWAGLVVEGTRTRAAWALRAASRARVSYVVQDDIEEGVLHVTVSTRKDVELSVADIKRSVSVLYQELPDTKRFDEIRVHVDGVDRIVENLPLLLKPLSHYAALGKVQRITVVSRDHRINEITSLIPADRFTVEAPAGT